MPIPTPNKNETQTEFISRCMRALNEEYPDSEQRAAICYSQWKKRKPNKNFNRKVINAIR